MGQGRYKRGVEECEVWGGVEGWEGGGSGVEGEHEDRRGVEEWE